MLQPNEAPAGARNTNLTLKVIRPTVLKQTMKDSSELSAEEKIDVHPCSLPIVEYEATSQRHVRVKLANPLLQSCYEWYGFEEHVQIWLGDEELLWPDSPAAPEPRKDLGPSIFIPGVGSTQLYQSVLADLKRFNSASLSFGQSKADTHLKQLRDRLPDEHHFSWAEFTHSGTRLPEESWITHNMLVLAFYLNIAREKLGKPLSATSVYRPVHINRQVGGAKYSQHIFGGAADLKASGENGFSLLKHFGEDWYRDGWGGVGIYPHLPGIIHVDVRCFALIPESYLSKKPSLNAQSQWGW